jgi:hypothetical protein
MAMSIDILPCLGGLETQSIRLISHNIAVFSIISISCIFIPFLFNLSGESKGGTQHKKERNK